MKIILLQELTGGLFGGLLNGRFKGLFAKTPVLAVLLLTAVVAACASGDSKSGGPTPADCAFAEDVGNATDCGLLALPQVFDSITTYNITFGEVNKGNTSKIGPGNFNFTQIIQGDTLNHPVMNFDTSQKQLTLSENASAVNITIIDITPNLFGEFYMDLDLVLVNGSESTVKVKVRYTISITPVNDAPTFSDTPYNFANIPFNSTAGYSVGNVSATDIDGDTVRYSIIGGTNVTNLFQISSTGEITLKKVAVNSEDSAITYTFNVTASDDQGGSARIVIAVSVLPFFRADCIFAEDVGTKDCGLIALPQTFDYATTYNITVGEVLAGQEVNTEKLGLGNFTFTQIINGNVSNPKVVTRTNNQIELLANATALNLNISGIDDNVFGEFYIDLVLVDNDEAAVTVRYTISITPVNDAPVFNPTSYDFDNILPGSPLGYSVGNVAASDVDGDVISYNISGGDEDNALFQINSSTGEITLKTQASDLGAYIFNVIASDGKGGTATATISVTVFDPTPPVFTSTPYNFNLDLSVANAQGVVVGNVSAMDADGTPFNYSLSGSSDLFDDLFELATADNLEDGSRNIILRRAVIISDFATFPVTFKVNATHQVGGLSSDADITVSINNGLPLEDDSDADGIANFYDAFPDDGAKIVNGDGNSSHPYIISNIYQLQAIAGVDHTGTALDSSISTNYVFLYGANASDQLTKHYKLNQNINASATNTGFWNKSAVGRDKFVGHGWTPIAGKEGESFGGSFNGDGYVISNLNIILRAAATTDTFGLFGTSRGNISAVGLENIEMRIQPLSKVLLIYNNRFGAEKGNGGLLGKNEQAGIIQYSYVSGFVNATGDKVGGLVGSNEGEISYSYSTAAVEGRLDSGGLVGSNTGGGRVLSSYATGNVSGESGYREEEREKGDRAVQATAFGGLIGHVNTDGRNMLNVSYAIGTYKKAKPAGGDQPPEGGSLVGHLGLTTAITSSYWYNNPDITDIKGIGNHDDNSIAGHAGLTTAQLQGCGLGATAISGVMPVPDCANLFPSSDWGDNTKDGVTRGWIFNAGKYPSLRAVRTSDSKQLFPTAAEQECQRNEMPLGCE